MESWYVVQTKPRQEFTAAEHLDRQSLAVYLPTLRGSRRRGTRWAASTEPLFPGYLFVRIDPTVTNVAPIRSTRGVIRLVTFGNELRPVPESLIDDLRLAQPDTQHPIDPISLLHSGDRVRLIAGPLAGLTAIFEARTGMERVAVLLDLLGRKSRVLAPVEHVVPAI
mgnify:CR=1 FL=1